MHLFHQVLTPGLVALALILPLAAQAENAGFDLPLVPTGALPGCSGSVAIQPNERGTYTFTVQVDGPLPDGEILQVDLLHQDAEERDLVLMRCELGRASFRCGPGLAESALVVPIDKVSTFVIYYRGTRILEAKMPG